MGGVSTLFKHGETLCLFGTQIESRPERQTNLTFPIRFLIPLSKSSYTQCEHKEQMPRVKICGAHLFVVTMKKTLM